jgi:probable HAF family extracellular repeat protein
MTITTVSRTGHHLATVTGVLLAAATLCPSAALAQAGFSVTVLPDQIRRPNLGRSIVMSDDASVVLGKGLWTRSDGYLPWVQSYDAISGDGRVIVGSNVAATYEDNTLTPHVIPALAGATGITAYAVSQDGSVIAGWLYPASGTAHMFRWTAAGGMVDLGHSPDGQPPQPTGISDDGNTIVGATSSSTYLWTADTGFESIGSFPTHPGGQVTAWDISGDGNTVVGYVFGAPRLPQITAFRWTRDGGFTGLGDSFGAIETQAYAVSDDGRVVVGSTGRGDTQRAMVWDPDNGMRDLATILDANGFDWGDSHLYRATDISADGQTILVDNLLIHLPVAVNLLPVPEPSTLAALPLAAVVLRRRRRR